ncbi:peptidyl-prolyl cis-trans isomerase, partial [Bacteroidales bacterium OttesenSCG-928-J19]|nr:peptidyl-prolyl cis-trans isomerase [Bacteroidales bacterium OttesenSCG-928-J19]
MRLIIGLVIVSLLAVSCREQASSEDAFIVKVYDKALTPEELNENIPSGLSYEDSTLVAEHYIQKWIMENLIYDRASKNIADKKLVDQLVENYKRSLIVYQYREQMVNENLSREISAEEVWKYYTDNKDKFQLEKTLVRGLFLKLPLDAPDLPNLKKWVKNLSESSLRRIE